MLWTELGRFGRGFDPWLDLDWPTNPASRLFAVPAARTGEFPLVNIEMKADEAVLTTEIPGIDPGSIEISVAGKIVTLKGSREEEAEKEGETYHRRERWHGRFAKTVEMPFNVETNAVEATFRRGVLRVVLPTAHAERPRVIKVESN